MSHSLDKVFEGIFKEKSLNEKKKGKTVKHHCVGHSPHMTSSVVRSYVIKTCGTQISIKSDVDEVVMITRGRVRDPAETISNWGRLKDGIETIHVQDATRCEDVTCLGNVYIIGKGVTP
ncbi:hypothetical protein Dsin_024733 [Dipteronia sinensis]|uniref:Uncharacterized protein n=1 Tax=Dipteronia sinensis TaxID=43782 RepID=A0AAD9ZW05_9ROSI|nr:hypothetical protein Dsin_024733 [Dipteronia sinensis]